MQVLKFKTGDILEASVIKGFSVKARVKEIRCEFGVFTFWMEAIENKYPISFKEIFIANQADLSIIEKKETEYSTKKELEFEFDRI